MTIPIVTVSATEANGFLIGCDQCPRFRTMRLTRADADQAAVDHRRRTHAQPSEDDERATRALVYRDMLTTERSQPC